MFAAPLVALFSPRVTPSIISLILLEDLEYETPFTVNAALAAVNPLGVLLAKTLFADGVTEN